MDLSPSALLAHSRTEAGRRAIRYSATSLICIGITQVLIILFYLVIGLSIFGWSKDISSALMATMITSVPAFALNKYWVWGKRGRAHMRREVLPFWGFTIAGWALSTFSVATVSQHVGTPGSALRTLSVMAASILGFGVLWVAKYVFLDKIMFGDEHHTPYDEDIELEEAGLEPDLS